MAVLPFWALMLLNRPKEGSRPIAESFFAGLLGRPRSTSASTKATKLAVAVDLRDVLLLAVTLWRARDVQTPK